MREMRAHIYTVTRQGVPATISWERAKMVRVGAVAILFLIYIDVTCKLIGLKEGANIPLF